MDENPENVVLVKAGTKRKRTKEQNFRRNLKGFAKRGEYGHGTQLSEEQAKYFLNILNVIESQNVEEKVPLAENVLREAEGQETFVSSNQIASKVVESLIGFSSEEKLEMFIETFTADLRTIANDKFASHVLQKMVVICSLRALSENDSKNKDYSNERAFNLNNSYSQDHKEKCGKFALTVSKFLLNNIEDFINDQYGNHVLRTCVLSLAGVESPESMTNDADSNKLTHIEITNKEWIETVEEYANRLRVWPQFSEFPYEELTSGFLQSLFCALKSVNKDLLKSIGGTILQEASSTDSEETKIGKIFSTKPSIRLLECLIAVAGKKLYSKIYTSLFVGNLKELSESKTGNYAVQKIFDRMKEKPDLEIGFDELSDSFENIIKIGHTGVLLAICKACKRLNIRQPQFARNLKNILCKDQQNLLISILNMKVLTPEDMDKNFIHIHGSVIIQTMLHFQKPIEIVNGILDLNSEKLTQIVCNAKGSHVIDAFFNAPFVGEKSKIKLIRKFEGSYLSLATNKFGSRVLEQLFEASDQTQKIRIVQELAEKFNLLESSHCGFIISKKFNVQIYKQSPSRWQSGASKRNAQKLFQNIISK